MEWDKVLDEYSTMFQGRAVEILRRKYPSLHGKKTPTRDSNMPPDVRLTKRVKYAIPDKAELGDGTGAFNLILYDDPSSIYADEDSKEVAEPEVPVVETVDLPNPHPVCTGIPQPPQHKVAVAAVAEPVCPSVSCTSGSSPRVHEAKKIRLFSRAGKSQFLS